MKSSTLYFQLLSWPTVYLLGNETFEEALGEELGCLLLYVQGVVEAHLIISVRGSLDEVLEVFEELLYHLFEELPAEALLFQLYQELLVVLDELETRVYVFQCIFVARLRGNLELALHSLNIDVQDLFLEEAREVSFQTHLHLSLLLGLQVRNEAIEEVVLLDQEPDLVLHFPDLFFLTLVLFLHGENSGGRLASLEQGVDWTDVDVVFVDFEGNDLLDEGAFFRSRFPGPEFLQTHVNSISHFDVIFETLGKDFVDF